MRYLVGVDIGGTFTDFVAYDRETADLRVWKNASTPHAPIEGVLTGLESLGDTQQIEHLRLGTTIATNALLERKGGKVAYVTTEGFKDIPFIQRGNRRAHYDMSWIKTKPLVKRADCLEVAERIDRDGQVLKALDEAEVRRMAQEIKAKGDIEAVAVVLLFSYLDPSHERRLRDILAEELPDLPVSISYEVLPKWKEYERASTTLADAYLKPVVRKRFDEMRARFEDLGVAGRVAVIKSNGGEATLAGAMNAPVNLTVSGPTGGVVAAKSLADLIGLDHVVTFDMGGTSTDCSTVVGGSEAFTTNFEIEWGIPIQVPMIDVRTIGAGGGSIAWIDKGGMLRVGPQSAGAEPGPACYGKGGEEATVSDANLVLGRINPDYFLGGTMSLDSAAAVAAVDRLAKELKLGRIETALAIVQIANNNMVGALRSVLLERGLDPRDFTLMAFGGAGPLHACDLIEMAGIPSAVIPNHPGQFSAYGFTMTDARVDKQRTLQGTSTRLDRAWCTQALQELVSEAVGELTDQGYKEGIQVTRAFDLRYLGQNYELELPYPGEAFDDAGLEALWQRFHETHEARFGFSIPGETIELVNVSVTAIAPSRKPATPELATAEGPPPVTAQRLIHDEEGEKQVSVYRREDLRAGQAIKGPALIEEPASATLLRRGQLARIDGHGNIIVTKGD
ncbi:MAG: hydantoinase/oxoprolinase family protein [Rhodospirillales bacterium]